MTSKHTPGNWRWIDTLSCSSVYAGNPERRLVSYVSPSEEDRANARLFAAAPELLQTLQMVECVYRTNCVNEGEPSSVLDAMQAAIAKATGEGA